MPPLSDYAQWLVDTTRAIGLSSNTGFAPSETPHTEVQAWCELTQFSLTSWEVGAVRELSSTFVRSLTTYKDKAAPTPYSKREVSRDEAARNSRAFFASVERLETGEAAREALTDG